MGKIRRLFAGFLRDFACSLFRGVGRVFKYLGSDDTVADETFPILIATAFGLEAVVQHELKAMGLEGKGVSTGRVLVFGTLADVCRLNLNLRSAERVLIGIGKFDAPDFDALFERTMELPWERWIPREFAFPVDGRSHKSQLTSVPAIQRTVKKAIVNRLMSAHQTQSLPETGPTVRIEATLLDNEAILTIDTSGDGLHKRGYRTWYGQAALRETMAAALVQLSTWRDGRVLWDPFCGSGTIAIEAAMIGLDIAPGLQRRFDAERWSIINGVLWKEAREAALARIKPRLEEPIFGSDIDPDAIELAIRASRLAGVGYHIRFDTADFRTIPTKAPYGVVITNPPYGVRIGETAELDMLYGSLPLQFAKLPTWSFHILTGRLDLERTFGQEASRRRKLFNAEIECTYFTFLGPKPPRREEQRSGAADDVQTSASESISEVSASVERVETSATEESLELTGDIDALASHATLPQQHSAPAPALVATPARAESNNRETARGNGNQATLPAAAPQHKNGDADGDEENADSNDESVRTDGEYNDDTEQADDSETHQRSRDDSHAAGTAELVDPDAPEAEHPFHAQRPVFGPAFGSLRERDTREADEFGRCLTNNLRHLRKYPARGINAYRVYERDYPEVPLIIDRYMGLVNGKPADCYHAVEYEREHSRSVAQQAQWLAHMQTTIAKVGGVPESAVFLKPKHRQKGLSQFNKLADNQVLMQVNEDGLIFEVNLTDYIDTGLFLDHRLTRQLVAKEAVGKRFLNLFCYTGSFTAYAAAGGAKATASVDLSHTYLDWAERNLTLSGQWPGPHDLIRADVMAFLADHPRPKPGDGFYDLVVVDPPTFSNSKSTEEDWQVAESHGELFSNLVPLLAPGAIVYFSNNYRRFKLDEDRMKTLGLSVREITAKTLPPEYRNQRIHRCWRMELVGTG